ncbi:hypothetical protein JHK87_018667 [Glycine soja]|nr:hypothetical protein JHK87_018667 [Glycine soja]
MPSSGNFSILCYGSKFGEKDNLAPERQEGTPLGEVIGSTSGLIFGKGENCFTLYFEIAYSYE